MTCLPLFIESGQIAGGSHTFDVLEGQTRMVLTLLYPDSPVNDLDVVAKGPDGSEHEAIAAGPEPPMTIEGPAAGTWEIAVIGWSCVGSADYTVDLVFG